MTATRVFTALDAARQYGPVRRRGRVTYRNYHREIPGGLTLWEMLQRQIEHELAQPNAMLRLFRA